MSPVLSDPLFEPEYGVAWWSDRQGTTLVNWFQSETQARKTLEDFPEDFQYRGYIVVRTVLPKE